MGHALSTFFLSPDPDYCYYYYYYFFFLHLIEVCLSMLEFCDFQLM